MEATLNTSIVVTQDKLFFNLLPIGYTVHATLWADTEFEPIIHRQKRVLTKRRAKNLAGAMLVALEAMKKMEEVFRESEQLPTVP